MYELTRWRLVAFVSLFGLALAGCSSTGAEGIGSLEPSAEPTAEMRVVDADGDGYLDWPDGVIGRGYVIPPQPADAPPLPQWVKDFDPEMPKLAREPSEEGAKAFAEYVFASDFYEFNTGTTVLRHSITDRQNEERLKQLAKVNQSIAAGNWGRIDDYTLLESRIKDSTQNQYLIEVVYALSPPYSNLKNRESLGELKHEGAVHIEFSNEKGWLARQIAYSNGTFEQYKQ